MQRMNQLLASVQGGALGARLCLSPKTRAMRRGGLSFREPLCMNLEELVRGQDDNALVLCSDKKVVAL